MINLSKMKAPGDTRPTWRNGIIQIHITRSCDLSCIGCTQGSNLAGKPTIMTLENFERACESLRDYYGVIGIFGGNPTTHPKFTEICRILERIIPFEQRGLWSNNLRGYGNLCREIFNPAVSNLNVHTSKEAYEEFKRDWPEANLIGIHDSRHSPPYVAMRDMEDMDWREVHKLIEGCDINQLWSAMICQFRGELRAFFCELAGAQSMLHEHEPDYPDTGLSVKNYLNEETGKIKQWWQLPINEFENQIYKHCWDCGIPLRGQGDLAVNGNVEYVSKTHLPIYKLKKSAGKKIKLVTKRSELNGQVTRATDYIQNGELMENKLVVAVPTLEFARRAVFYDHLKMLQVPVGTMHASAHGQSPASGRNLMIQQALDVGATHILFIDDDIAFTPELYHKLAAHNVDMVSALYLMRNYPHQPIMFDLVLDDARCRWKYLKEGDKGLHEVVATGLGACLIRTNVFRVMDKPWIRLGELDKDNWNDDIGFFLRARRAGFKLFVDLDTVCGHMASVTIWPTRKDGVWSTIYDTSGTDAVNVQPAIAPVLAEDELQHA